MKKQLLLISILISGFSLIAQPGQLDNTFGSGGITTTAIGAGKDRAEAIALQQDERILVAGTGYFSSTGDDIIVVRYNTNGTLDTSFGIGGKYVLDIGAKNNNTYAIGIQTGGKVLVAGRTQNTTTKGDFFVVRLTNNGTLDKTFGTDGITTTDFGGDDMCTELVILSLGKFALAGNSDDGNGSKMAIAVYSAEGVLDPLFGTAGKSLLGTDAECHAMAVQSDGKILLGGKTYGSDNYDFTICRLNKEGTLDTDFASNGFFIKALGSNHDNVSSLNIQKDEQIVATGYLWNGTSHDYTLIRLSKTGVLDNNFGTAGLVTTPIGSNCDFATGSALQWNDKIIVAGYAWGGSNNDISLVKYNNDGSLDKDFGTNGITITKGSGEDAATAMLFQKDGKILVVGSMIVGTKENFAILRYQNEAPSGNSKTIIYSALLVYPNPASSYITIELPKNTMGKIGYSLVDIKGNEVLQAEAFLDNTTLKLELRKELATGLYILQLNTEFGGFTTRISIVR